MEYFIVCLAALIVAGLTLFSGFGLGTLLMPVFALFFPLEVAIAATAVVHLANNLFKLGLMGKYADRRVVALFAIPGAILARGESEYRKEDETEDEFEQRLHEEIDHYINCHNFANEFTL